MTYNECLQKFIDIGNQMLSLERQGFMIPYVTGDTIEKKKKKWVYTGKPIKMGETVHTKNIKFSSPELAEKKPIITYQSGWYSLAMYIIFCLTQKNDKREIEKYYGTKLYWALMRCLEDRPEDRIYLVI